MTKDVLLYLDQAHAQGCPVDMAESVARLWKKTQDEEGPGSDFTSVVKPMERAAGVTVGPV
jgi:3-hydroxyisobutyrate dehydrogenase